MQKTNKNPLISIVIPSRATNIPLLTKLLQSIYHQTVQDFEVIIVCDKKFSPQERNTFQETIRKLWLSQYHKIQLLSHHNTTFIPKHQGGASYVRNYGIKHAKGQFIQLFDDDNAFDADYLEKALQYYERFSKQYQTEVLITPTLLRRTTDKIQNQGFSDYKYGQARPQIHFLKADQEFAEIKMFSGNGIFGKAEIMQNTLYDEQIAWIAEDLDFVYSIWEKGVKVLVFRDLQVRHHERDKSILEEARIGNPASAQQKIRNLFLWTKKHGNLIQTLIFIFRSSWGICIRLTIKALCYGKGMKWAIISGLLKWYIVGWKLFLRK